MLLKPDRRRLLRAGAAAGAFGAPLAAGLAVRSAVGAHHEKTAAPDAASGHAGAHGGSGTSGDNLVVGEVDHARNGFDPHKILTDWDTGNVTIGSDGRRVREWDVVAVDKEVEVAPEILFPAWTFNGRIPGPTFRCTEGERLRINFYNGSRHPHTMHFHGIHSWRMDGVPYAGLVQSGDKFTYEFDAKPFGCHLYHCHALPLKRHIHKGMYGAFIVDPDPARHPEAAAVAETRLLGSARNAEWQEIMLCMNGFDLNFDDENEIYAVNTIPFAYQQRPIRVERGRKLRVYLVNVTEFDPINSFHVHGNFFDYYDHGTTLTPTLRIVDTIMQCQGQRGILEMDWSEHEPGLYMFHAHQSEFAELGWMSHFEVV
jgi:FtsP/CotA-like multicopper oxidase with cupredoxin domain